MTKDIRDLLVPPVSGKYGAPLGRPSGPGNDQFTVLPNARPFHLVRLPLDEGYDKGGAYWGFPDNLWGYVRGFSREEAQKHVRTEHPNARFFR